MLQIQELVTTFQRLSPLEQKSVLDLLQQTYQAHAKPERLIDLAMRYPGEWLAVVIPAGEDRYAPEQGYLFAHASDRAAVWQAIEEQAAENDIFVFFTGPITAKGFGITFHDKADTPEVATLVN
ncbi:MAG: hypothetical protein U0350_11340 [Caldilineaceae bacterium]